MNNSLFKFYMGEYISTRELIRDPVTNGGHFFSRIIILSTKGAVLGFGYPCLCAKFLKAGEVMTVWLRRRNV